MACSPDGAKDYYFIGDVIRFRTELILKSDS